MKMVLNEFSEALCSSLLLITLSLPVSEPKFSSGVIRTSQDWAFIDRFCFVSSDSRLRYNLHYPVEYGPESLYFYYDVDTQWRAAYNNSLSCEQRVSFLSRENNQILELTSAVGDDGDASNLLYDMMQQPACIQYVRHDNQSWYQCQGNTSFFSMRPRWWYLAVGNCNSTMGLYLEYTMLMTNGPYWDKWFHQFSFDEYYVLPITIVFLSLEFFTTMVAFIFSLLLRARKMLHTTYKCFMHSIVVELIAILLTWLHYDRYSEDGRGRPVLKLIGVVLRQMSTNMFILLLLLVAKGYTITRAKISTVSCVKLIVFIALLGVLHGAMMVWQTAIFDPAIVYTASESLPAYCIIGLRIIAWLWFLRSSYWTVSKYPQKRNFYLTLGCLLTVWFWAGPIMLVVANFLLDNWVRTEVVWGVDCTVMLYGYFIFLVLTSPLSNNKHFPYHVRTNQIAEVNFPQNVYEMPHASQLSPREVQQPAPAAEGLERVFSIDEEKDPDFK